MRQLVLIISKLKFGTFKVPKICKDFKINEKVYEKMFEGLGK